MVLNIKQNPRVRAALSLRALKKAARSRAECDLMCRGAIRNVSAWLSRATCRYYETLLVSHITTLEKERNAVLAFRDTVKIQVEQLQSELSELTSRLRLVSSEYEDSISLEAIENTGGQRQNWESLPETPIIGGQVDENWDGDLLDLVIAADAEHIL